MSDRLPILDELAACSTFTAMAEWLCRCPLAIFASHGHQIAAICAERDFPGGVSYARNYVALVCQCRDGRFKPGHMHDDDGNGDKSNTIKDAARALDQAVDLIGRRNVSWHRAAQCGDSSGADNA
jgi:hypothetical protein